MPKFWLTLLIISDYILEIMFFLIDFHIFFCNCVFGLNKTFYTTFQQNDIEFMRHCNGKYRLGFGIPEYVS